MSAADPMPAVEPTPERSVVVRWEIDIDLDAGQTAQDAINEAFETFYAQAQGEALAALFTVHDEHGRELHQGIAKDTER